MDDPRLAPAPEVGALASTLGEEVVGLYVGGSLASGDYQPGISDIDAVALVAKPLGPAARAELVAIHTALVDSHANGRHLHCVYVPAGGTAEVDRKHWTWASGELFRRPLSRVARAELVADPVVVSGPHPTTWLPPVGPAELREAARAELAGYWTRALRKRAIWEQDLYVDLGLTVVTRAEAAITDGVLITKAEAIRRMRDRGVPPELVDGLARRRAGELVPLTDGERHRRAEVVRAFLRTEVARLLAT